MSDFKIGTTLVGITALDALTTPVTPDPQFYYEPYREVIRLGDGSYRGIGAPVAKWHFPLLSLAQRTQFATFCAGASAAVYIRTPDADGTFTNYSAVMRLPDTEPPIKAGMIQGYEIRFEMLVEQA